jgi:hypothetical protein
LIEIDLATFVLMFFFHFTNVPQSPDGASIIGANWWASTIDVFPIAFNATESHARVLVPSKLISNLLDKGYRSETSMPTSTWFSHPTSARWGSGHPGMIA